MGVYKNYYNRRPVSLIQKWSLAIVCVFLLCSSMDCTIYLGEHHQQADRIRHQHHEYTSQLEKTLLDDESSKRPILSCPNCLYYKTEKLRTQSDSIRLEAIKHQILMKLGLKDKPNVTHHLPREVIMETLFRAEESRGFLGDAESNEEDTVQTTSTRTSSTSQQQQQQQQENQQDFDDFYGRTSEIITFAEQGQMLNDNRLLEFRMSREPDQAAGQEIRVRAATLWLRVDMRSSGSQSRSRIPPGACVPTLWVFTVNAELGDHVHRLSAQDFSELTTLSSSETLDLSKLGWQKFDLTETIRSWYASPAGGKLRLLVDCSGCCKPLNLHTSAADDNKLGGDNDPNRPFLVVHTDPATTKRVRRRALDCSGAVKNQCCKQRFYVNFTDLGWDDWVIAPTGYYANYCRGDCGTHRTPDTFLNYYTHVIEEIRKTQRLSGMQPCCAPLKFSSMSLIYFGPDSNIIKRDLPKMVVDECGCP